MDVLIPVVFPDYKIAAMGRKWEYLGHAGILFVLGTTGTTKYYEYGRYDTASRGIVRKRDIPNAKLGKGTGLDPASLGPALLAIARQSGQSTRISGAFIEQAHAYPKVLDYVESRRRQNRSEKRTEYRLLTNNCGTFMQEALEAGGVDTPWMIDPRPNSYIEELRSAFRTLDFDPKTKQVAIGK